MKNKKLIAWSIVVLIVLYIQYKFLSDYYLSNELVSNIIVFLSIIFGFYITSLAIFVTSKYVSDLYQTLDKDNPASTLLHTLVNKYKKGLNIALVTILYLFLVQFIYSGDLQGVSFSSIWLLPFICLILFNFIYSYFMLKNLSMIIVQEAKRKKDIAE